MNVVDPLREMEFYESFHILEDYLDIFQSDDIQKFKEIIGRVDIMASLCLAIQYQSLDIFRFIISADKNLANIRLPDGSRPIHYNHFGRDYGKTIIIIEHLMAHGADINATNTHGNSILHYLCGQVYSERNKKYNIENELIKLGADVNIVDDAGDTPLFNAVGCDNIKSVENLLLHGAKPNIQCKMGNTAMHYCAPADNEMALLLINHGADFRIKNHRGRSAVLELLENSERSVDWLKYDHPGYEMARQKLNDLLSNLKAHNLV